jgi:hypothetical protein
VGSWVRIRNGLYKGDLARVVDVDGSVQVSSQLRHSPPPPPCQCTRPPMNAPSRWRVTLPRLTLPVPFSASREQKCTIKVVPRLDLAAMANRKPEDVRANFGKQPKVKPPAKPFNPDEVRSCAGAAQTRELPDGSAGTSEGGWLWGQGGALGGGCSRHAGPALLNSADQNQHGCAAASQRGLAPSPPLPQAKSHRLDVVQQRDRGTGDVYYILNGNNRFLEGYLIKTVALKSLELQEALPPLDELQKFNAAAQTDEAAGGDLASLVQNLQTEGGEAAAAAAASFFEKNDRVLIVEGAGGCLACLPS